MGSLSAAPDAAVSYSLVAHSATEWYENLIQGFSWWSEATHMRESKWRPTLPIGGSDVSAELFVSLSELSSCVASVDALSMALRKIDADASPSARGCVPPTEPAVAGGGGGAAP